MHKYHHRCGERGEHAFLHMVGRLGGRGGIGSPRIGGRHGGGGRGGPGDVLRAGRMLADGDLKLITLFLLAEQSRHGYDIIKALEEHSSGFYSPSPGVVYPTLTFLEEAGFAVSSAQGNKKVFSITEDGQAHLAENRELVERVLEQLERIGRKMAAAREWFGWNDDEDDRRNRHGRSGRNPEFHALRRRLRAALADIVDAPAERQAKAITILTGAAEALELLSHED